MISESPEFKDELDRITRVGRSIGVNLLLAAQRPVGVTDQMRANIKYRMCLRVEACPTACPAAAICRWATRTSS